MSRLFGTEVIPRRACTMGAAQHLCRLKLTLIYCSPLRRNHAVPADDVKGEVPPSRDGYGTGKFPLSAIPSETVTL